MWLHGHGLRVWKGLHRGAVLFARLRLRLTGAGQRDHLANSCRSGDPASVLCDLHFERSSNRAEP